MQRPLPFDAFWRLKMFGLCCGMLCTALRASETWTGQLNQDVTPAFEEVDSDCANVRLVLAQQIPKSNSLGVALKSRAIPKIHQNT